MGLWADYPIALAPGMGENFFFVSMIMSLTAAGVPEAWRAALGLVFVAGIVFLVLSVAGVREAIIDAVSPSMRNGIAVGIGLFIAFIGLRNGGLIVANAGTLVGLNTRLASADGLVFAAGLLAAGVLQIRKVRGAILWAILVSAALALALGKVRFAGIVGLPHIETAAAFRMDLATALNPRFLSFVACPAVHERVRHGRHGDRGVRAGRVHA